MFSLNFLVPHAMICITIVTFPILVPFLDWVLAGGKLGPWLLFWGLVPLSSPALLPFPTHQALLFPNRECLCRAVWPGLWPGSRYSQTERDCMELMRPPARVSAVGQNTMPHKNNIAPSTLPALRFGLISVFSIASPDGAGPLTRGAGFSHSAIVLWIPPTASPSPSICIAIARCHLPSPSVSLCSAIMCTAQTATYCTFLRPTIWCHLGVLYPGTVRSLPCLGPYTPSFQ